MKKKFVVLALVASFFLTSCSANIEGTWESTEVQDLGFILYQDGSIGYVNPEFKQDYTNWQKEGSELILSYTKDGEDHLDKYQIEKLDKDTLILKEGEYKLIYKRKQ